MFMQTLVEKTLAGLALVLLAASTACTPTSPRTAMAPARPAVSFERALDLAAPKPGRARPLIAVLADNAGTETTDFVVPYGVLKASGVADVVTVSTGPGAVRLIPALRIRADMTLAQFDAANPAGADILVVPAVEKRDAPALLDWVRAQYAKGAAVVSICEGAWVIANAGLLDGKFATTHWFALGSIAERFPATTWVRDRRWVVDGNVMTTTGVSASIPASLALVEAIAGRSAADRTARSLGLGVGLGGRGPEHDTGAFALTAGHVSTIATNWLARWRHETVELPLDEGFDEIATALAADAWSRTYRSRARVTNAGGAVLSRRGLIVETEPASPPGRHVLPAPASPATFALDATLDAIGARYGEPTANLVALELEYRRRPAGLP